MTDSKLSKTQAQYQEMLSALADGELTSAELDELMLALVEYPELKECWYRLQVTSPNNKDLQTGAIDAKAAISFSDSLRIKLDKEPALEQTSSVASAEVTSAEVLPFAAKTAHQSTSAGAVKSNFEQPVFRFAIAASVMVVAVFAWMVGSPQGNKAMLALIDQPQTSVEVQTTSVASNAASNIPVLDRQTAALASKLKPNARQYGVLVAGKTFSADQGESQRQESYLSQERIQNYMMFHAENASLNNNKGMLPFARVSQIPNQKNF